MGAVEAVLWRRWHRPRGTIASSSPSSTLAFLDRGNLLVVLPEGPTRTLEVWSLEETPAKLLRQTTTAPDEEWSATPWADALIVHDPVARTLRIVSAATGARLADRALRPSDVELPWLGPPGELVAENEHRSCLRFVSARDGRTLRTVPLANGPRGERGFVNGLTLAADGTRILRRRTLGSPESAASVRLLEVLSSDTGQILRQIELAREELADEISPDGERVAVAFGGGAIEVWELSP